MGAVEALHDGAARRVQRDPGVPLACHPFLIARLHAHAPDRAEELPERLRTELDPAELFVTEFTPVIGAHVGPGLVGCALHAAEG